MEQRLPDHFDKICQDPLVLVTQPSLEEFQILGSSFIILRLKTNGACSPRGPCPLFRKTVVLSKSQGLLAVLSASSRPPE